MAKKKATRSSTKSDVKTTAAGIAPSAEDGPDFETALAQVERIVSQLESGELGLTESLSQYEIGIKQLKRCHRLLDVAEQRVSLLSGFDADGNPITEPLEVTSKRTGAGRAAEQPGSPLTAVDNPKIGSLDDAEGLF